MILIGTAVAFVQFSAWLGRLWFSVDSGQRTGVLIVVALAALAALAAAWRARPRVVARTRVVTTRVARRPSADAPQSPGPVGELEAEWRPAQAPEADGGPGEAPGKT